MSRGVMRRRKRGTWRISGILIIPTGTSFRAARLAAGRRADNPRGSLDFEVPNDRFLAGERHLRAGGSFPPLILLTSGSGQYVIVEGHLRATAYALAPEYFAGTHCYVGTCSQAELKVWNGGYE